MPRARQPACCTWPNPTKCSCCRPRPRSSTRNGRSHRPKPGSTDSAPPRPGLAVLNRRDAEADENVAAMRVARFVYIADGSPLHLRSVLKGSALYDAMLYAYGRGAVIAASGAGATVRLRPDGRSARRRVHSRARHRAQCCRVPRPREARPTIAANGRWSSSPPTRCSSASTRTPRSSREAYGQWNGDRPRPRDRLPRRVPRPNVLTDGATTAELDEAVTTR